MFGDESGRGGLFFQVSPRDSGNVLLPSVGEKLIPCLELGGTILSN